MEAVNYSKISPLLETGNCLGIRLPLYLLMVVLVATEVL